MKRLYFKRYSILVIIFCVLLSAFLCVHCGFAKTKKTKTESGWHYNRGNEFLKAGKYQNAVEEYQKALEYDPRDTDSFFNLAQAYLYLKQYNKAVKIFKDLHNKKRSDSDVLYNLGLAYQLSGDNEAAIKTYKKVVKKEPLYQKALNNMGTIYMQKKNYKQAEEFFTQALAVDQNSAIVKFNLGKAYFMQDRYPEAISMFQQASNSGVIPENYVLDELSMSYLNEGAYEQAADVFEKIQSIQTADESLKYSLGSAYLKTDQADRAVALLQSIPKDSKYYWNTQMRIGSYYFEEGKVDEALEAFFNAYLQKKTPEVADNIGQVLYMKKEYEKAQRFFKEALKLDNKYYTAWYNLGHNYYALQDNKQAIDAFSKAVYINKKLKPVYIELARIYIEEEQINKAEKILKGGLRYCYGAELLMELANVYLQMKEYEKAEKCYKDILRMFRFIPALNALGALYIQQEKYKKAVSLLERIVNEDPKNPEIYNNLGTVYAHLKRFDDSMQAFQTAIKLAPGDTAGYFNLALVYYQQGQLLYARKTLKSCLAIDPNMQRAADLINKIEGKVDGEGKTTY